MERDRLAEEFERARPRLRAVAYRMLGSLSEADDAVQESWLRLNRSDADAVANLGGRYAVVNPESSSTMIPPAFRLAAQISQSRRDRALLGQSVSRSLDLRVAMSIGAWGIGGIGMSHTLWSLSPYALMLCAAVTSGPRNRSPCPTFRPPPAA